MTDGLAEMQPHLQSDEAELIEPTNALITQLKAMSDENFTAITNELLADFE